MPQGMRTIFVIDAQAERRSNVCRVLLEGQRHVEPFETIGEFLAFSHADGIALVHDEGGAAVRLCREMRDSPRLVPVIGYAADPALDLVVEAMQAGAASYLAWPFSVASFAAEIDRIGPDLRKDVNRKRRTAQARSQLAKLTAREREVLVSLITHGTNKAIAIELDISPRTVEKYRAAILDRLDVDNSAQAVRLAVESGAFDSVEERDGAAETVGADRQGALIG